MARNDGDIDDNNNKDDYDTTTTTKSKLFNKRIFIATHV